jgi:hypothetical protein
MADPILQVPMRESVTVTAGESITINFTNKCCFCCDPTKVNNFTPPLPIGDHLSGDTWTGVATVAGTVSFHHLPYGSTCPPVTPAATGGRSIIVGS